MRAEKQVDHLGVRRLEPRLAAVLAYMLGLVTGIILLRAEREDRFVRFHALQSILFSSCAVVGLLSLAMLGVGLVTFALAVVAWAVWAILMLRAARGEMYQLPLIGRWAEANV